MTNPNERKILVEASDSVLYATTHQTSPTHEKSVKEIRRLYPYESLAREFEQGCVELRAWKQRATTA